MTTTAEQKKQKAQMLAVLLDAIDLINHKCDSDESGNANSIVDGLKNIEKYLLSPPTTNRVEGEKVSEISDSEIEKAAEEYAEEHGFRVPYDGSNNFYDDKDYKWSKEGFTAGMKRMRELLQSKISNS